jgi:hypothetical protein
MPLAAVAGTALFAGNIFAIPLTDLITEPIDFSFQILIVPK